MFFLKDGSPFGVSRGLSKIARTQLYTFFFIPVILYDLTEKKKLNGEKTWRKPRGLY